MAKTEYNFKKLEKYLERDFINPNECILELEHIEEALQEAERLFILNPALSKALNVHRKIIECINDAIPDNRKPLY